MYLTPRKTNFCIKGAELDSISMTALMQWGLQQQEPIKVWRSHSSGAGVYSLLGCETV